MLRKGDRERQGATKEQGEVPDALCRGGANAGSGNDHKHIQAEEPPERKTCRVQTPAEPPKRGRMAFAAIGWMRKISSELRNTAAADSASPGFRSNRDIAFVFPDAKLFLAPLPGVYIGFGLPFTVL
jgi:hypothetical protein